MGSLSLSIAPGQDKGTIPRENAMKAWKRARFVLAAAVIALTPATRSSAFQAPANPVPAAGQVSIYRDQWGVPNIYAAREADGFFGLG